MATGGLSDAVGDVLNAVCGQGVEHGVVLGLLGSDDGDGKSCFYLALSEVYIIWEEHGTLQKTALAMRVSAIS